MTEPAPLPFLRSTPSLPESPWASLGNLPLTVLVGVTGVGKSTALQALREARPGLRILPDRREVTDAVMIWPLAGGPVTDREQRFRLTAGYRATHPGGMAQALGSLQADTTHWGTSPVFDGLRGLDEVQYAAATFPRWRFVALGAPDAVRVRRLLGRADAFDRVTAEAHATDVRQSLSAIQGVEGVFSLPELDGLAALTAEGHRPAEIVAKARIVVSERQNYDPHAAEAFLQTLPRSRALLLDTVALNPAQVAQSVREWAADSGSRSAGPVGPEAEA